jgi:hypothetical protein
MILAFLLPHIPHIPQGVPDHEAMCRLVGSIRPATVRQQGLLTPPLRTAYHWSNKLQPLGFPEAPVRSFHTAEGTCAAVPWLLLLLAALLLSVRSV